METYSVLTRLPSPRRLSPAAAEIALTANFLNEDVEIVALGADGYRALLQTVPAQGIAGGRVYDAVILACARVARAQVLLTFNDRDFRSLVTHGIEIVVPAQGQ